MLVLDAAHNPAGAAALAEALPAVAGGRPVIAALAVLADKDVRSLVGALAPVLAGIVATEIPARPPGRRGSTGREGVCRRPTLPQIARDGGRGLGRGGSRIRPRRWPERVQSLRRRAASR